MWTAAESLESPQTGGTSQQRLDPRVGFIFREALKVFEGGYRDFLVLRSERVVNTVACGLRAPASHRRSEAREAGECSR